MSRQAVWDPARYGTYSAERARPFAELLARVPASDVRRATDLGCGTGALTATLAERWPLATIDGLDSSPEMIAEARPAGRVRFRVADLTSWEPDAPQDLIVSNAALHWIPGHTALLPRWAAALAPGGVLAFQVPGNFAAPSHTLLRELCAEPRWRDRLDGLLPAAPVLDAAGYLRLLTGHGLTVDAWETTYAHLLPGPDPVLEWTTGSTLRPVLAALDAADRDAFRASYAAALRAAYPPGPHGTVFPFRRVFVVARAGP
ncbi:trans-aconitate 2-methyltransferase [Actinomadura flavalba]|uniref:trans-aconitate 2-methyltransferase n=1 Tax=Actinomadura flavalba TaxID=1120938 RepID=UPI000527E105|nr:trans-aconitate 2-methyltransferase [Actinomadura flavalba]